MRTLIIIIGGFLLLAVFGVAARLLGNRDAATTRTAVNIFVAVWFIVAAGNLILGVAGAGYTFAEELPIFLVIFALPAAAAILFRKLSTKKVGADGKK